MNLRQVAWRTHPDAIFLSLSAIIAPFALRPESTIYPIMGLLSVLLIYTTILFRNSTAHRVTKSILLIGVLSIGSCVFRIRASLRVLSTSGISLLLLFSISAILSALAVAAIFTSTKFSTQFKSPLSRMTLFPAVWATLWCTVSCINPVGYLATWSPADNADAYNWVVPYLGPAGKDWIIAAWAVVISEAFIQWFLQKEEGENTPLLTTPTSNPSVRCNKHGSIQKLAVFLAALLVPYFISSKFPVSTSDVDVATPLSVGCALPAFSRYKKHVLELDDYIKETNIIRSNPMARIILWPEGAVTFNSAQERENAFAEVRKRVGGVYVGISFEETVADPDDSTGRKHITRTGLAVVHSKSNDTHMIYYKRHLVPVAESYRLRRATFPPTVFEAALTPPKDVPASKWSPMPDHTRPFLMTSSICLDFAIPSPFDELQAKPNLILAPARTWDLTVGNAMWLQAKQRAAEMDSIILWCDGGEGGVSGVAGGGFNDISQVGSGSFLRTIAIPYPFNPRRTLYARLGDWSLVLMWMVIIWNPRKAIEIVQHHKRKFERPEPERIAQH